MNISINKAFMSEADSLTAIQKQAFERLYNIYQDEANPYLRGSDEIKRWLDSGASDVYSIYADENLCGGITVRNKGNGEYYLHRIYILPHLQGKGIARKAIELCEKFYPQARMWTVDFPADQIANKKCYEASGYYDTGKREKLSDTLTIVFYEKAIEGIYEIRQIQLELAAAVIRKSFITVANEFNLTKQNCPKHTAFSTTPELLQNQFNHDWLMYGLFSKKQLAGYVSLSKENDNVFELHNLSVSPENRHCGYGRQLLDFCKEKVRELSATKIKIGIIEENTVLKSWYTANGFVHTGKKQFEHLPFTVGFMEWNV